MTSELTARAVGSGDLEVLATPVVLALAEEACVALVAATLEADATTVGVHAVVEHLAPSKVGTTVEVEATLVARDGRDLRFDVVVRDGETVVATIHHRRVEVDRERFLARLN